MRYDQSTYLFDIIIASTSCDITVSNSRLCTNLFISILSCKSPVLWDGNLLFLWVYTNTFEQSYTGSIKTSIKNWISLALCICIQIENSRTFLILAILHKFCSITCITLSINVCLRNNERSCIGIINFYSHRLINIIICWCSRLSGRKYAICESNSTLS